MIASSRQRNLRRLVMSSQPRSRRTRFTATSLAVVALALAAAAPAAQARPAVDPPVSHHETQRSALVVTASNAGFDWGSAGIGAAAGAGLVLVGAGSFALTYRGRVRVAR
jgi:hypothetical protein